MRGGVTSQAGQQNCWCGFISLQCRIENQHCSAHAQLSMLSSAHAHCMDRFQSVFCHTSFGTPRAPGGESPARIRVSQRRCPTMNILAWLKPGSHAGSCRHEWRQAEPGGTVTALTAQRFDMQNPTCTRVAIGRVHANVGLSDMFVLKGTLPYQLWTVAMFHTDFRCCATDRRCASSTSHNAGSA